MQLPREPEHLLGRERVQEGLARMARDDAGGADLAWLASVDASRKRTPAARDRFGVLRDELCGLMTSSPGTQAVQARARSAMPAPSSARIVLPRAKARIHHGPPTSTAGILHAVLARVEESAKRPDEARHRQVPGRA
jgi:hypothetical protein